MHIDIFYSYACRDSYLVFAWLKLIEKTSKFLAINWRPFAIQMDDSNEYWNHPWATANSELKGFIAAESAKKQGNDSFLRFHHELEKMVHEEFLELDDETTLIGAAQKAGLDIEQFQADWHNSQLIQIIKDSHNQAIKDLNIFGTPSLVFPNGLSFHLELNEVPLEKDAFGFFQSFESITAKYPYIKQLKQINH